MNTEQIEEKSLQKLKMIQTLVKKHESQISVSLGWRCASFKGQMFHPIDCQVGIDEAECLVQGGGAE